MSDPFIGEIQIFAGRIPAGWLPCDGRMMSVSQDHALFSVLGTAYGGDGKTTFALPDLRGRVPISFGQGPGVYNNYNIGQKGGEEQHTLSVAEMPSHSHYLQAIPNAGLKGGTSSNQPGPTMMLGTSQGTSSTGGSLDLSLYVALSMSIVQPMDSHTINDGPTAPHENRMPYVAVNYCIATQGSTPPT